MSRTSANQRWLSVIKLNMLGEETWRYQGELLSQDGTSLVLEAFFDREDTSFHGMLLAQGDRFVETYYTDRWYNIFEIHAKTDDHLRGWYCNIATPARITSNQISYMDLALDLLVFPDGKQIVLDEDEFNKLEISSALRESARKALEELQAFFTERTTKKVYKTRGSN
jgi:predicted RNA-binding protein associated with RNAse of E/G family